MSGAEVLGAVAATAQLGTVVGDTIRFASDVRHQLKKGPAAIQNQQACLTSLVHVLELIQNDHHLQRPPVLDLINRLRSLVSTISDILQTNFEGLTQGSPLKVLGAYSAIKAEKKLLTVFEDLDREKITLILHLSFDSTSTVHLIAAQIRMSNEHLSSPPSTTDLTRTLKSINPALNIASNGPRGESELLNALIQTPAAIGSPGNQCELTIEQRLVLLQRLMIQTTGSSKVHAPAQAEPASQREHHGREGGRADAASTGQQREADRIFGGTRVWGKHNRVTYGSEYTGYDADTRIPKLEHVRTLYNGNEAYGDDNHVTFGDVVTHSHVQVKGKSRKKAHEKSWLEDS